MAPTRLFPRTLIRLALLLATLALFAPSARAQMDKLDSGKPALLSADQVTYDEALGIVTASGNVEITQGARVLKADSVTYNQRTRIVTASGNVALLEPNGDVAFADYVELSDDLAEGFIREVRLLLADKSRIAANRAVRTADGRTVLSQTVYSPCELCQEDPDRAPLWQIKASQVEHDAEAQKLRYRDARLEMFGVPVLYTPYFEHADWTVDRQSGLLAPSFGSTDFLGSYIDIPYYWNIAPEQDATITLRPTTDQNVQVSGEYRHLLENGRYEVTGSATVAERRDSATNIEKDKFRGHIDSFGRFDLTDVWRWGYNLERTTDDTYLRSYDISTEQHLTSRLYAEGLQGRNYMAINAFTYQTLRANESDREQPIIAPMIDLNYMSEPGAAGGVYSLDANFMALNRIDGRQSRRLSLINGWALPYTSSMGDVYTLRARLQTDGYLTHGVDPDSDVVDTPNGDDTEFAGRVFPQLALEWRYPWFTDYGGARQTIEPITQIVLGLEGGNPGAIPNEDSLDVEFDTTNLFSLNRFSGIDRVDPGQRVDYGVHYGLELENGFYSSLLLGQSYRFDDTSIFGDGTGLEDPLSDYVGQVEVSPIREVDLAYSFRLDKDDLAARRHELFGRFGVPALTVSGSYLFAKSERDPARFPDREELRVTLRSQLTDHWIGAVSTRHDFQADRTLQNAVSLTYRDECFTITGTAKRDRFRDREIEPEDTFLLTIQFKNLGGFGS